DLSIALTNLVKTPTNAVYKSQALAALDTVIGLLSADPATAGLTTAFRNDQGTLDQASGAAAIQAAIVPRGDGLQAVDTTLVDETAHQFTLAFVNNSQVGVPQVASTYQLVLRNTGAQTTTYDFSAVDVPAGVTVTFSPNSITLAPGQVTPAAGVADVL